MAIHFLHIRKTGGSAVKFALRQVGGTHDRVPTPAGPVLLQRHPFRLTDVPEGQKAMFVVRDPVTRFVSGFYSRLRKGAPRNNREWSEDERVAFGWFSTPQELATALGKKGRKRMRAEFAMDAIRHLQKPLVYWTGDADGLRNQLHRVLYIARQESLDEDFERMKALLGLPKDLSLPTDPVDAHRFTGSNDRSLTPKMIDALREWYRSDYEMLEVCDAARSEMIERAEDLASAEGVQL